MDTDIKEEAVLIREIRVLEFFSVVVIKKPVTGEGIVTRRGREPKITTNERKERIVVGVGQPGGAGGKWVTIFPGCLTPVWLKNGARQAGNKLNRLTRRSLACPAPTPIPPICVIKEGR